MNGNLRLVLVFFPCASQECFRRAPNRPLSCAFLRCFFSLFLYLTANAIKVCNRMEPGVPGEGDETPWSGRCERLGKVVWGFVYFALKITRHCLSCCLHVYNCQTLRPKKDCISFRTLFSPTGSRVTHLNQQNKVACKVCRLALSKVGHNIWRTRRVKKN